MMDGITLADDAMKSLPPSSGVMGLKYDEICVRFSFSVTIKRKRSPSAVWSWYVLAGDKEPDGDWKFWGLVNKNQIDFGEFRLGELRGTAESWNSELQFDTELEFIPLSSVMEKLGLKWHNCDG